MDNQIFTRSISLHNSRKYLRFWYFKVFIRSQLIINPRFVEHSLVNPNLSCPWWIRNLITTLALSCGWWWSKHNCYQQWKAGINVDETLKKSTPGTHLYPEWETMTYWNALITTVNNYNWISSRERNKKTRVGLDFVTIKNRILKLNFNYF